MASLSDSLEAIQYKNVPNRKKLSLSEREPIPTPLQTRKKYKNYQNLNLLTPIDLLKQSKLTTNDRMLFTKSYYYNLLKIKYKNYCKQPNLPYLKTFTSDKPTRGIPSKTMAIFAHTNFPNTEQKTMNFFPDKKIRKNWLYKRINNNIKQNLNLKFISINKLISPKKKENTKINPIESDYTRLYSNNKKKFTMKNKIGKRNLTQYLKKKIPHVLDKKTKDAEYKYDSVKKIINNNNNKYKDFNNKELRQFFLEQRLKDVKEKVSDAVKDVEEAKINIERIFNSLNKNAQVNIEHLYKSNGFI